MKLSLIGIFNANSGHSVGGQDLPNIVTIKVTGTESDEATLSNLKTALDALNAYNIGPSTRHPQAGLFDFATFSFDSEILDFFNINCDGMGSKEGRRSFARSTLVMTIGELKQAIADLPDDFPLIHTQPTPPAQRSVNAQGLIVCVGEWVFDASFCLPGQEGDARWALRITELPSAGAVQSLEELAN